jgi:hypothetical protein
MSVYTHDDIQNAVEELEKEGLGDFLYQEPTARKHSSSRKHSSGHKHSSSRKHSSGHKHSSSRKHSSGHKHSSSRKHSSGHKHSSGRKHSSRRTSCFRPRRKRRYWHDSNMHTLWLELD